MKSPSQDCAMHDFDEGLGTTYERLVMNEIFDRFVDKHSLGSVLEVPVFGMTGLTGINSFEFVKRNCNLTLVDNDKERIAGIQRLWGLLGLADRVSICYAEDFGSLPFKDNSFDFVWNFAALWHVRNAPALLKEIARVSSNLVFISVQNRMQIGYPLRKYVIDKHLFSLVHEEWLNMNLIKEILQDNGISVVEEGVFDIPPFPDIAMPVGSLMAKVLPKRRPNTLHDPNIKKKTWKWNIMPYYAGEDKTIKKKIERLMFIEKSPLPRSIKSLWAHHRYVLGTKR